MIAKAACFNTMQTSNENNFVHLYSIGRKYRSHDRLFYGVNIEILYVNVKVLPGTAYLFRDWCHRCCFCRFTVLIRHLRHYKTFYNRYSRWSARGIWQYLFREIAGALSDGSVIAAIDSTDIKAYRSADGRRQNGRKGGALLRAIGISKGGHNTKLHAISDRK